MAPAEGTAGTVDGAEADEPDASDQNATVQDIAVAGTGAQPSSRRRRGLLIAAVAAVALIAVVAVIALFATRNQSEEVTARDRKFASQMRAANSSLTDDSIGELRQRAEEYCAGRSKEEVQEDIETHSRDTQPYYVAMANWRCAAVEGQITEGKSDAADTQSDDEPAADEDDGTFTARGQFTLIGEGGGKAGNECEGSDGYGDIRLGTQVTVYDAGSQAVGIGSLAQGLNAGGGTYDCVFNFSVDDIPDTGSIYSVEVAQRGTIQFTKEDAGYLQLSLGD